MVAKFVNDPHDPVEERFLWLESQVVDLNFNVNLLMEALTNMTKILGEYGSSNVEV